MHCTKICRNKKTEHIKLLYGLFFYSLEEAGCLQRGKKPRRVLKRHQRQRRCVEIRMTDGIERMIK